MKAGTVLIPATYDAEDVENKLSDISSRVNGKYHKVGYEQSIHYKSDGDVNLTVTDIKNDNHNYMCHKTNILNSLTEGYDYTNGAYDRSVLYYI